MKYINMTCATKTFYGVEFKPGDVKEVPGFINAAGFIRTDISEYPKEVKKSEPKAKEQAVEQTEDTVDTTEAPADEETEKPKRGRKSKESEN